MEKFAILFLSVFPFSSTPALIKNWSRTYIHHNAMFELVFHLMWSKLSSIESITLNFFDLPCINSCKHHIQAGGTTGAGRALALLLSIPIKSQNTFFSAAAVKVYDSMPATAIHGCFELHWQLAVILHCSSTVKYFYSVPCGCVTSTWRVWLWPIGNLLCCFAKI